MPSMLRSRVAAATSAARHMTSAVGRLAPARAFTSSMMSLVPSLRRGSRFEVVPPRADAGHDFVIAVNHLHRPAKAVGGVLQPQRAGLGAVLLREPGAVVAPHARAFLALERLPRLDVDRARAQIGRASCRERV